MASSSGGGEGSFRRAVSRSRRSSRGHWRSLSRRRCSLRSSAPPSLLISRSNCCPEGGFQVKDLIVNLENKPGMLAGVGELLGIAGVNIEGICGAAIEGAESAWVHLLFEDGDMAISALEAAGVDYGGVRDVEVVSIVDQPGEMGRMLRKVADAGVNVDLTYLATSNRLVLGGSDIAALRDALHAS